MAITCGLVIEGEGVQIPLKHVTISTSVHGFLANVEACLKYSNTGSKTLEVVYVFPVDDNSAVYKCEADIDGRHIVAEIQEKEQARETYNEAVRNGRSAVLMEEHDTAGDIFRCKLGNLPPNSDANIKFAFVTELEQETDGSLKFVLPTVLNPRYNPSKEDGGSKEDTSFSYMNSCHYKLEFEGTVSSKHGTARVWSDTDKLTTSVDTGTINTMKIGLAVEFSLTHNLSFNVLYDEPNKPHTTLEKGKIGEPGSFLAKDLLMLSFYPDLSSTVSSVTSEFIFIIDRSGSMSGQSILSAKEAMLFFLKSLPVDSFFNIVSFGSSYEALFPEGSKRYGEDTLKKAMDLQASLQADMGGTEILRPLEFVFRKKAQKGYPRQVFLLTDGGVSNANEVIALVKRNSHDSRVFTVGIGNGVSTTLVRNVAKAGGGQVEFVTGKEKLQQKVMKLLKAASQPAVSDLGLDIELPAGMTIDMMLPKDMPVIFSGQRCTLFAFLNGSAGPGSPSVGKAQLTGQVNGKHFSHTMTFDVSTDTVVTSGQFVHRMAIKGVIKDLEMDEKDSGGDKKREIIVSSTAGNIISKYTSFVGVDKEKNEKIGEAVPHYIPSPYEPECCYSMPPSQGGRGSLLNSIQAGSTLRCQPMCSPGSHLYRLYGAPPPPPSSRSAPPPPPPSRSVDMYGYQQLSLQHETMCDEDIYEECEEDICFSYSVPAPPPPPQRPGGPPPPARSLPPPPPPARGAAPKVASFAQRSDRLKQQEPLSSDAGAMVMLQAFDGSWSLTKELAVTINTSLDKLCEKAMVKDTKVWATGVAVCWLTLKCPEERSVWEMVVSKARDWLVKQLGGQKEVDKLLQDVTDSVFGA